MKTTIYTALSMLFLLLFMASCQKDNDAKPSDEEQGVAFQLKTGASLKSTNCFSEQAEYAKIVISDVEYTLDVYYIGSVPYTKTLKLPTGDYTLTEFMLMDDNQTPDDTSDDVLIAATPHEGSEFAQFVDQPLNIDFTVEEFEKTQLNVQVLCYEESDHSSFGFVFYEIGQVVVREQFFFGDVCICRLEDYANSLYANQSEGLQLDMPAIAKIEVFRNGTSMGEYSNEAWYGEGQPLRVLYADVLNQVDSFEFKLSILVKQGLEYNYVHFHTWRFVDDEVIEGGEDGVVDFVLGNCEPGADLVLAPWMNIPPTATYTITNWNPDETDSYVEVTLSNIETGFEFTNGVFPSNCADHATPIYVNHSYDMNVYSSLYPDQLPVFAQSDKWEKINWLYNHLDWYENIHWYDLQGFIWLFDEPAWDGQANGSMPALTELSQQMKADADQYGVGYKVPPGGNYVVVFIPPGSGDVPMVQTMISHLNSCD